MLSIFEIVALLLALSGLFGWINLYLLQLPHTIGMLMMALVASVVLLAIEYFFPYLGITEAVQAVIGQIDFYATVMEGMLAFLLFAGAMHVDFAYLRDQRLAIGLMATGGILISTFLVGTGFWYVANLLGHEVPYIWALVFGALISPTDPVAVLSLLKSVNVPHSIEAKIAGESLFNDGVGVVLFSILLVIAVGGEHVDAFHVAEMFFVEAGGGALLGLVTGWLAYRAMATIDEYSIEVLITLGVVAATYALAQRFHLSGPIAVVITGLLIGNHGARYGMSELTRKHLFGFWEMIDEILNSILFLLIGLEVLILQFDISFAWIAASSVPITLAARFISVSLPILLLSINQTFAAGAIPVLTWGGLRGGISVALALSLPMVTEKPLILTATYAVVLFSIIVQGLTVKTLVNHTVDPTLV